MRSTVWANVKYILLLNIYRPFIDVLLIENLNLKTWVIFGYCADLIKQNSRKYAKYDPNEVAWKEKRNDMQLLLVRPRQVALKEKEF